MTRQKMGEWHHSRNKAVAWQEHQPAHRQRIKREHGPNKRRDSPHPSNAQSEEEVGCREWKPKNSFMLQELNKH